jgi:Rod binding domain-containing protein
MKITEAFLSYKADGPDSQKSSKLVAAAQEFEALLMQELLKPMRAGQSSWGDEENDNDSAADTISSFGTEAVAKAMSKGGGLRIARQITRQITLEQRNLQKTLTRY